MSDAFSRGTPSTRSKTTKKWPSRNRTALQARKSGIKLTNPVSWSHGYKMYLGALGLIANFSTAYAGGSYTSATDAMAHEWKVSDIAVLVGVTLYMVAFGVAPMVLAPFSELNGRCPVVLASGVRFVIGVLFCAVTHLYVGMLLARVLVGIASSTFAVVIVGVVADIDTDAKDRYTALTLFTSGAMFGTGFGRLVSAFIVQNTQWLWVFGVPGIFCLIMVAVIAISFKETRSSVLLSQKAKALSRLCDHGYVLGISGSIFIPSGCVQAVRQFS